MSVCPTTADTLCGCCAGVETETPEFIGNRPALSCVGYRAGRYATFDASMTACLSQPAYAPMSLLRTRDPGDFSIALIDSWAVVLDILTFYQERFANEAWLRTARDARSVFELSRLIGYVPSPGVAATGVVAFTLSDAPGSPDNVPIPAGTRIQSVPGPGQKPQVFETAADLIAQIGCNALPAQTDTPWQIAAAATSTWIDGVANNVNVGDMLLFIAATQGQPDPSGPAGVHAITSVTADTTRGITLIGWDAPLSAAFTAGLTDTQVCLFVLHKKAALYGVQAPYPAMLGNARSKVPGKPKDPSSDWDYSSYVKGSFQLNLDASYAGLAPAAEAPAWAVMTGSDSTAFFTVSAADEANPNRYTLTVKTTRLTFGFGAMLRGDASFTLDQALAHFEADTRNVTVYVQSAPLPLARSPLTQWSGNPGYAMASGMLAPVGGNSVTVEGGQRVPDGQPVGVSGKRVRLRVLPGAGGRFAPAGSSGAQDVPDGQVFLVDAYPPDTDGGGAPRWSVVTLSGVSGSLQIDDAHVMLVPSARDDTVLSEASKIATTDVRGDFTAFSLDAPLARLYDAVTVRVNANAVDASHGETVQELLGSGNASNAALTFTLKQTPLTYVSSTSPTGIESTLQVWVNNLRWHEASNLLAAGPADRVFVTRADPAGATVLQFGDGINGARPPTGQMNIRAVYRKGIGSAGMVAPGQLAQALDRPQGLKSAVNPGASAGGADPASADDARSRAPLPTLTIGRVVSLDDYRNYALNFGGIAKAVAAWTYFDGTRGVFLTVAGAAGAVFKPDDDVILNLIASLRKYGNEHVPLRVASYEPVPFQIAANVQVDADHDAARVLADAWTALASRFAFERRLLGQTVAASDVIEIVQGTPGVVAMQLSALFPTGSPGGAAPAQLCASGARPPRGAQLLLLDPACQHALGEWS